MDRSGAQTQAVSISGWLATHEPEIAAAAEAIMAAHDAHTIGQAIRSIFAPHTPSEKISNLLESNNPGDFVEGVVASYVENRFGGPRIFGQELGQGDLVDVRVNVPDPQDPTAVWTELDIQMTFAVVEIKSGTDSLTHNLNRKQSLGLPVVIYAPQATAIQQRQIFSRGAIWVWNVQSLLNTLDQLKAAAQKKANRKKKEKVDVKIKYRQ